ncbi:MAG: D-tyrosyl-tRNA(Tyr) deacylase [Spirochaetales bacterium]|nr:D-tyrosyl-tRNA(Tyr) deacylase [Spirochaetales bacterium]
MKVVLQRVRSARVEIDKRVKGEIGQGLLILLGIIPEDTIEDIEWLVKKISQLRVFNDDSGVMNLSVQDVNGGVLLVSQFTLHASIKKGNRPYYGNSAPPNIAIPLYEEFHRQLEIHLGQKVPSGEFGADMDVSLVNWGPVTIIMDSKNII